MSRRPRLYISAGVVRTACEFAGRMDKALGHAPASELGMFSRVAADIGVHSLHLDLDPYFPERGEGASLSDWYRWYLDAYELESTAMREATS